MRRYRPITGYLAVAAFSLVGSSAPALVQHQGNLQALVSHRPVLVPNNGAVRDAATLRRQFPEIVDVERLAGGPWDFAIHGNGTVRRALGTGIPLIPGTANSLVGPTPDLTELERIGRGFLERLPQLLGHANLAAEWVLSAESSQPLMDGHVRPLRFTRAVAGVAVENSQIQLVFNHGNLIYLNATGLEPITVSTSPTLDEGATWAAVTTHAGALGDLLTTAEARKAPGLALIAVQDVPGDPLRYRLVRRHVFTLPGRHETWQAEVDAHDGELLGFHDTNAYACALDPSFTQGQVRGGVRAAQATDPEEILNLIYPAVDDAGTPRAGDANGYFPYGGGTARSRLGGTYFSMNCIGCSPNPPDASSAGDGLIDFGTGGVDQVSNGRSTPADRTCFYHLNAARAMAAKWISRPWMNNAVEAQVNVVGRCNAFWNGSNVGFFRSGGGCANTGEIRDVMQHEWGHGLDSNDGLPARDWAMGEAYGDYIALFIDRDSCIGQSFAGSQDEGPYCVTNPACAAPLPTCTGVRNIDEKRTRRGLMTMSSAAAACAPFGGPCGPNSSPLLLECHCEAEIYGQAAFHLAYNFLTGRSYATSAPLPAGNAAFSDRAAWFLHERLFFNAAQLQVSYAPSHRQTFGTGAYDAYTVVDDDDGNPMNGTPHAAYINEAFQHHEIQELTLIGDSANCVPPTDPTISVQPLFDSVTGKPQVEITWADSNAQFYVVLRNNKLSDTWLPIRSQVLDDDRASYVVYDEPVQIGRTYNYVVMAVGSDGCPSPGNDVETLTVGLPDVTATMVMVRDPLPGGDNDGIAEPGEAVRFRINLREVAGLVDLRNADVVVSTRDPLATVTLAGPLSYGTVTAGGSVAGPSDFEIGISVGHACGTRVPLIAVVSAENGCLLETFALDIPGVGCVPAARGEAVPTTLRGGADDLDPGCTDSDNLPDNGESFAYDVTVTNPGTLSADNVRVSLLSTNPNVAVVSTNPVSIPLLNAGGSSIVNFTLEATGAGCQETATMVATADSDANAFPVSRSGDLVLEEDRTSTVMTADFETDFDGWTADGFVRTMARRNGGAWSAYAGPATGHPCDASGDGAGACATLTSASFVVGAATQLQIANWYRLEDPDSQYYDRANVHLINLGTGGHSLLTPLSRPYQGGNGQSAGLCHISNQNGWAGSTAGASWGNALFDLSAFVGSEVRIEINYNTDSAAVCEGLFVDDVVITNAIQRSCDTLTCSSVPSVSVESCTSTDLCTATGSGDGVVDPGDEVSYQITLRNSGTAAANDVQGSITVVGGAVVSGGTIGGAPRIDLPAGSSIVHNLVVQASGVCGDVLDVDVVGLHAGTTVFPDNLGGCDRPIGVSAPARVVSLDDDVTPPLQVPESLPVLIRELVWAAPAVVNSATLTIQVTHARLSDLQAWLVGPRTNFVVADAALNGALDVTGLLNGDGTGTYQLVVFDKVGGTPRGNSEVGTLESWSLVIDHQAYSSCTACTGGCASPAFSVLPSPPSVCADGSVNFLATFTDPGSGGFDYEWDFGDGSPPQIVTDPLAPTVHRFDGALPSYNVTLRAVSRTSPTCDATDVAVITIDPGTAPSGGGVGNRLRMYRRGRGADLVWPGSPVTPPRFRVMKAFAKIELADTATGIGDEGVLAATTLEQASDPGALLTPPGLAFYEVHPATSCGASTLP